MTMRPALPLRLMLALRRWWRDDVLELARYALVIEQHYGRPMDIEWGKDGRDGKIFILQARPETVQSRAGRVLERFERLLRVAGQRREVDLRVRVVGRQLNALNRDEADARILDLAQQLGQVALDLIGDLHVAIGRRTFFRHGVCDPFRRMQKVVRARRGDCCQACYPATAMKRRDSGGKPLS